ncbi:MAG: RagB/SusD family nutrient uptake outer membrane protein [Bacteroides sp.]|nr:RagB/SusD family nutrient uptake outer membrane protein [Bacteroides sp.]
MENMLYLEAKKDQLGDKRLQRLYSITGYWPKKLVCYENIIDNTSIMIKEYPFPIIRLADLYLMYAEALNESLNDGEAVPPAVYESLDLIRKRSGLEGVKEYWQKYSINPTKPDTKEGMREIIRRERSIELALETHRFFDIRRWKLGLSAFNTTLTGWSINESETQGYYQLYPIGYMRFTQKDYLWPIKKQNMIVNPQLIQNPGW